MANLVVTVLGDDRAGLVNALAEVVAAHGGNWERSHMAELAGKFAGIVLVSAPEDAVESLARDLESLEAKGLFDVTAEVATDAQVGADRNQLTLELVGQDHPGIVQDLSRALATHGVSIDELETEVEAAPMGGMVFRAKAVLLAPPGVSIDVLSEALEAIAQDLMVDLDLSE